jgi:methylphosphotriester-DNA--protein-cysteine methyltransferase
MGAESKVFSAYTEVRRTGPGVHQIDHAHYQLEFNLIISGRGTYFLEDGQHDLVPGTLVWLLPEQSHRLMRSPDLDMWMVMCERDGLDDSFLSSVSENACRVLSTEDVIALDRLLSHIAQDVEDPTVYQAGLQYAVRSAHYVSRTTAGPAKKRLHPAVLQALSILRSNPESPTASALAKMCGVNPDYLGQLLSEQTGRGFVEWRNRTRLERFAILYPESGDLLTAALAAGFGSYAQFHRVCVDLIGATPGEWAKSTGHSRLLGAPADASTIQAGSGGSTRMACYTLCGIAFPLISRQLGTTFVKAFLEDRVTPKTGPVDSGIVSATDFRQLEGDLVEDLRTVDEQASGALRRIFDQNDIFELHLKSFPHNWPLNDLAYVAGVYIAYSWCVVNRRPYPRLESMIDVIERTRRALYSSGFIDATDAATRQKLSAAIITQTMIMRFARVGSLAMSVGAMEKIADVAHQMILGSLGMDHKAIALIN